MAEYINRTRLLADILDAKLKNKKRASLNILSWFENLVQRQPVADVVKVVRCKDCKHQEQCCEFIMISGKDKNIDFCSYGERRDT